MSHRSVLLLFVLGLFLVVPSSARAYVYWTPEDLLASYFPAPAAVTLSSYTPDAATRTALTTALGYAPPATVPPIHVGRTGEQVVGYAILDSQLGQHEPIDFGVLFRPDGTVARVEILVYREAYGDGVRGEPFRRQFVGLGPGAPMRPGKDIRVVSGATISTRSISTGVRRATLLLAAWLGHPLS